MIVEGHKVGESSWDSCYVLEMISESKTGKDTHEFAIAFGVLTIDVFCDGLTFEHYISSVYTETRV